MLFHCKLALPKLYVIVVLGKMSLLTSPVKLTVSVARLSPSCILPSAVILPVACKLPVIVTFEFKLMPPVPLAVTVMLPLVSVELSVFPVRLKLPTRIVPENTVGLTPLGVKLIVLLLLLIVLPVMVIVAMSA